MLFRTIKNASEISKWKVSKLFKLTNPYFCNYSFKHIGNGIFYRRWFTLFNLKDIGEVFRNKAATKILMAQLAEEKRYKDVIDTFHLYIELVKNEMALESSLPSSLPAELLRVNKYIETDQIDILTRVLLLMVFTCFARFLSLCFPARPN